MQTVKNLLKDYGVMFVGTIALLLFITIHSQYVLSQIKKISFHKEPEDIIELYFPNYQNLPKYYSPTTQFFSFTINNQSNKNSEFNYMITAEKRNLTYVIETDKVSIPQKKSLTLTKSFILNNESSESTKVKITLLQNNQEIHFQLTNPGIKK